MKVVQINTVCGSGSTGKICVGISRVLDDHGIENYILYTSGQSNDSHGIKHAEPLHKIQALRSRVLGNYGFNSTKTTKILIAHLERIKPDVVHLHNLHGHNCNLSILMDYFRENNTKLIWTFHDCWAFTAYCPHFVMEGCDKWETGCHHCPQRKAFSWFFDRSRTMYDKKQSAFSNLNMTIVTPSKWLADLVKRSFLYNYPVKVVNNGINLDVFKPSTSDFRKKHSIADDKFIILGVAIQWVPRKGADVFIRLSQKLSKEKFQIIMVGTDDEIDKNLPDSVISIHKTENVKELIEIYSAADLFVNPTREDTFPTVNMESLACGTPVLTFKTGGSPEIPDDSTGRVVACNDEEALYNMILDIERERPFTIDKCVERAKTFDEKIKFREYRDLYLV